METLQSLALKKPVFFEIEIFGRESRDYCQNFHFPDLLRRTPSLLSLRQICSPVVEWTTSKPSRDTYVCTFKVFMH